METLCNQCRRSVDTDDAGAVLLETEEGDIWLCAECWHEELTAMGLSESATKLASLWEDPSEAYPRGQ